MRNSGSRLLGSGAIIALALAWAGWSATTLVGSPRAITELTGAVMGDVAAHGLSGVREPYPDPSATPGGPSPADDLTRRLAADPALHAAAAASAQAAWADVTDGDNTAVLVLPGGELTAALRRATAASGLDPTAVPQLRDQYLPVPGARYAQGYLTWAGRWPLAALAAAALAAGAVLAAARPREAAARLAAKVAVASAATLAGLWVSGRLAAPTPGSGALVLVVSTARDTLSGPVKVAAVAAAAVFVALTLAPTPAVRNARGHLGRPVPARSLVKGPPRSA